MFNAGFEQNEQKRLQARYAAMSDEELCSLAKDASDLTESAQQLLHAELQARDLHPEPAPIRHHSASEVRGGPIVIAKFISLHEASIAAGQLEAAGVPCLLYDENLMRLDWLAGISIGGVRLAVEPEYEEEARELLSLPIPERFEVDGIGEYEQPRCPKCGSLKISSYYNEAEASTPEGQEAWRCHDCGALWQGSQDDNPPTAAGSV